MATKPEEQEHEEELVVVETPPDEEDEDGEEQDASDDESEDESEDDASGGEDDERLSENEEDTDPKTIANREKRRKRREMQRKAREAQERKMAKLEREAEELKRKLAQYDQRFQQSDVQAFDSHISRAQKEVQDAEFVIGRAVEAGNGADVVQATRIRDEARDKLRALQYQKQQYEQQVKSAPKVPPAVVNYAKEWVADNPWYDPNGSNQESVLTKQIDRQLLAEGYDPADRGYWEELTERVAAQLAPAKPRKRNAPPTGTPREHVPKTSRKEVYLSPERIQAIKEAGAWDDPVRRQQMVKAYLDYDARKPAR